MTARENIRAWRECASLDDIEAGTEWYPLARRCAQDFAVAFRVSADVAAGVIAVLSPRTDWDANLRAADALLRAAHNGEPMPPVESFEGVYGANIRKAWRIIAYGEGYPRCDGTRIAKRGHGTVKCNGHADSCPAADYLHGPKVHEFAETILGKTCGRVVDVWATRAADVSPYEVATLGRDDPRRAGDPGTRFHALQRVYAEVAADIGEDASVLQAIVWTCIRRTWRRANATQTEIPW